MFLWHYVMGKTCSAEVTGQKSTNYALTSIFYILWNGDGIFQINFK